MLEDVGNRQNSQGMQVEQYGSQDCLNMGLTQNLSMVRSMFNQFL